MQDAINYVGGLDWSPVKGAIDVAANAIILAIAGLITYYGKQALNLVTNAQLMKSAGRIVGVATLETGITIAKAAVDPKASVILEDAVLSKAKDFGENFAKSIKRLGSDPQLDASDILRKNLGDLINKAVTAPVTAAQKEIVNELP